MLGFLNRRKKLPAERRPPLARDERLLAWAQTPEEQAVVATNLGDCHGRLAYRSVGWYFPTEGETSLPPGNGYEDICDGP